MNRPSGLSLCMLALFAGCAAPNSETAPGRTRQRPARAPCVGSAWVEVQVVDSVTRTPSQFGEVHAEGWSCWAQVVDGAPALLGPLPPGEHMIGVRMIGASSAPATVRLAEGDTARIIVAVEPHHVRMSGDDVAPDDETVQPPRTITRSWLERYAAPGCFHGCVGPYFDRIWRQIGGRADARAALLQIVADTSSDKSLQRSQAILFLGRLDPPPYDVLARLLEDPDDSTTAWSALWGVCSPRADSLIGDPRLAPYDRRIGCGAPITAAAPGLSGTYAGEFPCPDCEAVRIELSLDTAGTYRLRREYVGLGDPIVAYGTWLPDPWGYAISLLGDENFQWGLVIEDSTTLLPSGGPASRPMPAYALTRRPGASAVPSATPCRIGRHRGGIVEVIVEQSELPASAVVRTTASGCSGPLRPWAYRSAAWLGPLPPGRHEVVLEIDGRVVARDTIRSHAGHRTYEVIPLD